MVTAAAVDAIDLTTYEGEDPYLIHERACLNCRIKESQKPLTRCSGCAVVWYCSNECVEADSERHGWDCVNITRSREEREIWEQRLREQHQIEDPYVPSKNICSSARQEHRELYNVMVAMCRSVHVFAAQGDTKELWEMALNFSQKTFKMLNTTRNTSNSWMDNDNASNIAFTLIRLGRLENAWRFIRNTMVQYAHNGRSPVLIQYEPQDRFTDCLDWVRSSRPIPTTSTELNRERNFNPLVMALFIIKLRIRVAAARNAWKETIKIFLKTCTGWELEPVKYVLEEYFSLSDDTVQLEQARKLISIDISFFTDKSLEAQDNRRHDDAVICVRRTPRGHEILSAEPRSMSLDEERKLYYAKNAAIWVERCREECVDFGSKYTGVYAFARYILCSLPWGMAILGHLIMLFALYFVPYLFMGVLQCAAGAIVGPERSWGLYYKTAWAGVISSLVLLVVSLAVQGHKSDATNDDLIYGLFKWFVSILDEMLPICVFNIILWWKVVPTPRSMDIKKGTRVLFSTLLMVDMIFVAPYNSSDAWVIFASSVLGTAVSLIFISESSCTLILNSF